MRTIALLGCVLTLAASKRAAAQSVDGAVRLSLDATVLSSESLTLEPKDGNLPSVDVTETSVGLFASSLGIGVGYAPSDAVVLGAKVQQGITTRTFDSDAVGNYETSQLTLLPYFEFILSPGAGFQPYLGAAAGLRTFETTNGDVTISKGSTFLVGIGAGGHGFATSDFSIDPAIGVYRVSGTETIGDSEFSHGGWAVLASFSLSGWIGATAAERRREEPVAFERSAEESPPETRPRPRPRRAASSTRDDREAPVADANGTITTTLKLRGATLTLTGQPASPSSVTLRMTALGVRKRLEECKSFVLVAGKEQSAVSDLKYAHRASGSYLTEALQGSVPSGAIAALGEAQGTAHVRACDMELTLGMPERAKMYDFFEALHGLEPGAWSPPSGVRLTRGKFTLEFRIGDSRVRFVARPRLSAQNMAIQVEGLPAECSQLEVVVADAVRASYELSRPGTSTGVASSVPVTSFEAQSGAEASWALRVCGTSLPLSARKRKQLAGFIESVRAYGAKVSNRDAEPAEE
ncbi:MAG: hypothetical protein R3B13_03500 [Polyangiaceae bacterium]